jgi:3-mercaptopyruvate sulfurtransferase SseA
VLDLRDETERTAVPIRGTVVVPPADDRMEAVMDVLDDLLTPADRNKPLVIVDQDNDSSAQRLVADLRVQGINALLLDGGAATWQADVLAADATWPDWVVGGAAESTISLAAPRMADYHDDVRAWMTGTTVDVPSYLSIPGTEQLPSEAATVVATGSGGGGCG